MRQTMDIGDSGWVQIGDILTYLKQSVLAKRSDTPYNHGRIRTQKDNALTRTYEIKSVFSQPWGKCIRNQKHGISTSIQ